MKFTDLFKLITPIGLWRVRTHETMPSFIEAKLPGMPYGREILAEDYTDKNGDHDDIREADVLYVHHTATQFPKLLEEVKLFLKAYEDLYPTMSGPLGIQSGRLNNFIIEHAEKIQNPKEL